jgi:hypothetical protein
LTCAGSGAAPFAVSSAIFVFSAVEIKDAPAIIRSGKRTQWRVHPEGGP